MSDILDHPAWAVIWAAGLLASLLAPDPAWLMGLAALSSTYHLLRLRHRASKLLKTAFFIAFIGLVASGANLLFHASGLFYEAAFLIGRMAVASSWTFGLVAAIDAIALRRRLRDFIWFRPLADFLDTTIFHAGQLARQWQLRLQSARQRGARWRGPAAVGTLGLVLGRGAIVAFDRSLALEQTRWLRSAPISDAGRHPVRSHSPDPILELDDLVAGYRADEPSLFIDDLCVDPGQWIALAGASGSGKTTLLRVIAGLVDIHQGTLHRLQHTHTTGQAGPHRRIAMVLQNPDHQFLGSTPRDDLRWGLRQHHVGDAEASRRIDDIFEQLAIGDLADRPLRDLSFGQRRLVALASALVTRPDLLLCDEITSGLDPLNTARVLQAIDALPASDTTVIWATHDLHALPPSIDRMAILCQGRLHFQGTVKRGLSTDILHSAHLIASPSHSGV